jgi:hypothetical protein
MDGREGGEAVAVVTASERRIPASHNGLVEKPL